MLISAIVDRIEFELENFDVPDTAAPLIDYINDAMDYVSMRMAEAGDPEFIAETVIAVGSDRPANFLNFVPKNGFPYFVLGGKFAGMAGAPSNARIRYSYTKPHVSAEGDTFPMPDYYAGLVMKIAALFALNKNEANIESDTAIMQMMADVLAKSKGG
jgi:hypothetical protein